MRGYVLPCDDQVMHEIARAEQDVYVVKFDPTDQFIAVGYGDGKIRIYYTGDGDLKIEINANNMGMDGYDERPITNLEIRETEFS